MIATDLFKPSIGRVLAADDERMGAVGQGQLPADYAEAIEFLYEMVKDTYSPH